MGYAVSVRRVVECSGLVSPNEIDVVLESNQVYIGGILASELGDTWVPMEGVEVRVEGRRCRLVKRMIQLMYR